MRTAKSILLYTLLSLSALILFFPILFSFLVSFMSGSEVLSRAVIPSQLQFENYQKVFDSVPLFHYLRNSFVVSALVMLGQLVICSLAAFVFAFIPF